jgi:hypothetical protein
MSPTDTSTKPTPRLHPGTAPLFKDAESRHFTDEELDFILKEYPEKAPQLAVAREVRSIDVAVINRVVKEIYAQYPYEEHHEFATSKCPRDVRYVVAYAVQSMIEGDGRWFEDKLLIWLKTILQAFDFPERTKTTGSTLFSDQVLEEKLAKLPKKSRSIFHMYYRLEQEMAKALAPGQAELLSPYLSIATNVLSEDY